MPAFFDMFNPAGHERRRVDAVASEAAAWTVEEMRAMLSDAGLTGMHGSRARPLGMYQAWWARGTRATDPPLWIRPPMSEGAAHLADRTAAVMSNLPRARPDA
jgi:hypothetical protein